MRQLIVICLALFALYAPGYAGTSSSSAAAASKEAVGSVKEFCKRFEASVSGGRDSSHGVQQCIELINSGVSQQRFLFDKAAATICAQTLNSCGEVLTGLKLAGSACESALDCTKPLVCAGPRGGAPGHCAKPLALGASCDDEVGSGQFFAHALAKRSVCGPGARCTAHEGGAQVCSKDQ